MPDPAPAPEPRGHPPPRGVQHAVLALLSIAPALDGISIATASPTIAAVAARVAHLALLAAVAPALVLAFRGR